MGNNGVWCVLLVGLLLVASVEGDDWSAHLNLKPSAGEAGGVMVAKGSLPDVRFSICDVWCEDRRPNVNHRLCVQNLCPYDKTPKRFSAGEARGAMLAKGGPPAVRLSICDVWCEDVHPNMNHRLCVQNLCPYDKTPRRFSAGEVRGAMLAKGGLPAVRLSICDVWCEDVHPNMNHRLCIQNLCPYDKTPRVKLTSNDLLSA